MKNCKLVIIALIISMLALSACGKKEGNMSAEDVFKKASEVTDNMKSLSAKLNVSQEIQGMDNNISGTMEMIYKPEPASYSKMSIFDMDIETITVDNKTFMKQDGEWTESSSADLQGSTDDADIRKQIGDLSPFSKDAKLKESGDNYIITMNPENKDFQKYLEESMAVGDSELAGMLDDMKFSDVEYSFTIDKKSYKIKSYDMNMTVEMKVQNQTVEVVQKAKVDDVEYDSVKEIKDPTK